MWTNLVAGAFNVPTPNIPALSTDNRIALLKQALAQLKQYRDNQMTSNPSPRWGGGDSRPSMIFVAPEYMFTAPGFQLSSAKDLKRNRFLSRGEHDGIVGRLQEISAEYGKQLVLVPGSIA